VDVCPCGSEWTLRSIDDAAALTSLPSSSLDESLVSTLHSEQTGNQ